MKIFIIFLPFILFAEEFSPRPKLYQSLWPNFCYDHLWDWTGCSEAHPLCSHSNMRVEGNYVTSVGWDTFLIRADVSPSKVREYQELVLSLPLLQESCAHAQCSVCDGSVRKSIERYGATSPFSKFEYLSVQYECKCQPVHVGFIEENGLAYQRENWDLCRKPAIPFAYFNRFTSQYAPFLKHHLEFCKENTLCTCYWPYVSILACKISDLVYDNLYDLYPHIPSYKREVRERSDDFSLPEELQQEFIVRVLQNHFIFAFFYSNYHTIVLNICQHIDTHSPTPVHDLHKLYTTLSTIQPLFLELYSSCLEKHPHPKIFYERGMVHFHSGDFFSALADMRLCHDAPTSSEFYLSEGTAYAELGLYDKAFEALNLAITKDPQNKEAYFERAAIYFEAGDFERSLSDYFSSGFTPTALDTKDISSLEFARHLIMGLTKGSSCAVSEFGPSLLASTAGLSHGLWAFVCDPAHCSQEMVIACKNLLSLLAQISSRELLEALMPEIKELGQCSALEQQAELLGFIIGKYGTDIFAPAGLLHAYKHLRSANRLLTLNTLAKASEESVILKEASTKWMKAHLKSIKKCKDSKELRKAWQPLQKPFITETMARKILHESGFPTFPRPKGIPANYRIRLSDKPGGMKYVHPEHTQEQIRIMPGNPNSPNPCQQKPYVKHHIDSGLAYDEFGNKVSPRSPESHIPLEKFVYRTD